MFSFLEIFYFFLTEFCPPINKPCFVLILFFKNFLIFLMEFPNCLEKIFKEDLDVKERKRIVCPSKHRVDKAKNKTIHCVPFKNLLHTILIFWILFLELFDIIWISELFNFISDFDDIFFGHFSVEGLIKHSF